MKTSCFVGRLASAAVVGGVMLSAAPAQAGLFDFLFGGGYQAPRYSAPPSYTRERAPLDVRVNPRKRKGDPTVAGSGKVRPGEERERKIVNKAIDPRQHPNWHLEDPTLRRGDIVVLPAGVMVYDGGSKPQTREDFTRLDRSPLVSKKEKERIQQMAGPQTTTAQAEDKGNAKAASGQVNPVQ